jgi:polysaccharide export outer membrane protein
MTTRRPSMVFALLLVMITAMNVGTAVAQQNENRFNLDLNTPDHRNSAFFSDPLLSILSSKSAPPQAFLDESNYTLRPGDILTIQLQAPENWSGRGLPINNSGDLWIPRVGPVEVGGQTFEEARSTIRTALKSQFNQPEFELTLDQVRPFPVYTVFPEVSSAQIVVSAGTRLSTLIERAFAQQDSSLVNGNTLTLEQFNRSGFSARAIRIQRADGSTHHVDLAPYLAQKIHTTDVDPFLLPDDKIELAALTKETPFVGISGAVSNAIELPFKDGDTLGDLIRWSGGLRAEANRDSLRVFQPGQPDPTIYTLAEADKIAMTPNSRVVVPYRQTDRSLAAARVEVAGEIRFPGTYPIQEGQTTVEEILKLSGGWTKQALPHAAYIQRRQSELPRDPLSKGMDTVDPRTLKRASDQLREGFEYLDLAAAMDQNRSFVNLRDTAKLHQTTLSNGDRLVIPRDYHTVFVFGQVNRPGYQPYESGQEVQTYLDQANGLTVAANPDRIFVIQAGTKAWVPYSEATIQSGDMIFVDRTPFDALNPKRNYEIQLKNLRRSNLQLILTTISTITAVITTYVALFR